MSRDSVLGLDGGGSKTILALASRDGSIAALHRGAGLDPHDNPDWRDDLAGMVRAIGPRSAELRRAVLGLSCHTEAKAVSDTQTAWVDSLFAVPSHVLNDVHVAFEGALAGRAGVLALAGTGSMAWAATGGDRIGARVAGATSSATKAVPTGSGVRPCPKPREPSTAAPTTRTSRVAFWATSVSAATA